MQQEKLYTLVHVRSKSKLLLGLKKRGFGAGKWNGFGGKVEPGETILDAAIRELEEESGLKGEALKYIGLLRFHFAASPVIMKVYVFETWKYTGEIKESEEMLPQWYEIKDIPYDQMWPDDELWIPYMLKGDAFEGEFFYEGETIVSYTLNATTSDGLQVLD